MSTLDKVRAIIRAEVERAHPIADARGPLELIVESAVRYSESDGTLAITVLDEAGQPSASRTIADVIADFRAQHPTLFKEEPAAAPTLVPAAPTAAGPAAALSQERDAAAAAGGAMPPAQGGGAVAARAGTMPPGAAIHASAAAPAASEAAPRPRDWLIVGGAREVPAAEPPVSGPSRLDEGLDSARAGLTRVADRLRPGLTLGPQALAARLGRMGQALRASVSMARATLQDFGDRPASAAAAGPVPAGAVATAPHAPRVEAVSARTTRQALIATGATPWFRRRHVIAAGAGALALVLGGAFLYNLLPFEDRARAPSAAVASAPPPVPTPPARRPMTPPDPGNTGSVPASPPPAAAPPAAPASAPLPPGALRGVPEVIDTATLSVGGKVVPLFGVQWSRGGGEPSDLAGYLRNREVTCRPAEGSAKAFRCEVEGQDLSKVVLFNGGGRATSEASPDLLAAEAHARSAKTGLWAKANP